MKKSFALLMLTVCSLFSNAQSSNRFIWTDNLWPNRKICGWVNNNWGYWQDLGPNYNIYGTYGEFILYQENKSDEYFFKVCIPNYITPDKETLKKHKKNCFEYDGYVEYYICDDYLTPYSTFVITGNANFVTFDSQPGRPKKRIRSNAKIYISPYKKHPTTYYIYYENVGVGIDFGKCILE